MLAREFHDKDPTTALTILREVDAGSMPREWDSLALQTPSASVVERVFLFADNGVTIQSRYK